LKRILLILFCFIIPVVSSAASKPKHVKTPKPSIASLKKELLAAKDDLSSLEAQKVSLTARVASLESDLKSFKKESDSKFMITACAGGGATAVCLIIIFSMLAPKAGVGKKKSRSKVPTVEDHFNDIEYRVLDDWHNIFFHPERIDAGLYEDLPNHFEPLYNNIEKWKDDINRRDRLTQEMIKDLSLKFKEIEATSSIYMIALPENDPFIEDNEIAIGSFICAHVKEGFNSDHNLMQSFYNAVIKMFDTSYAEIRTLSNEILDLKNDIDMEIRKIKHHRKLAGDCKYLHTTA
jgi:hypothetical protein